MKKRIAVDMDEVIAQVRPKFLDLYEAQTGRRLTKADYHGKKIYQVAGGNQVREALHEPGFFADLPVMPHSQEVLQELSKTYDIYIVTAAQEFRHSLGDKHDWLQQHFPFIPWKNYVFCGDKSIIRADYMIDDHIHNLTSFTGQGLLFTASHNVAERGFVRVDDWLEVRSYFQQEQKKG